MPALQVLHLNCSLPESCDVRGVEPISLRNLQHLHLVSPTGLSSVLSVIVVPTDTSVSLRSTDQDRRFASSLSKFLSPMGFGESKKPSLRKSFIGRTSLRGSKFPSGTTSPLTSPQLSLEFRRSLVEKVIPSIPLQGLSSLSLSYPIPAHTLIESFGKSQDLEVVTFAEEGVVGWTEAMEMAESQV